MLKEIFINCLVKLYFLVHNEYLKFSEIPLQERSAIRVVLIVLHKPETMIFFFFNVFSCLKHNSLNMSP